MGLSPSATDGRHKNTWFKNEDTRIAMLNLLMFLLLILALFLIVLILIQRGKGGGLAGALGGMGGQSAFGTKAGDLFTRITIVVATLWIVLCIVTVKLSGTGSSLLEDSLGGGAQQSEAPQNPAGEQPNK
jgi:preprotein translocase subunit SecG